MLHTRSRAPSTPGKICAIELRQKPFWKFYYHTGFHWVLRCALDLRQSLDSWPSCLSLLSCWVALLQRPGSQLVPWWMSMSRCHRSIYIYSRGCWPLLSQIVQLWVRQREMKSQGPWWCSCIEHASRLHTKHLRQTTLETYCTLWSISKEKILF